MKCKCEEISDNEIEQKKCRQDKEYERLLCKRHYKRPKGLGDVIERVLAKFGITPEKMAGCKCKKRKDDLNKRFPIK